jgi:hypothetical protein
MRETGVWLNFRDVEVDAKSNFPPSATCYCKIKEKGVVDGPATPLSWNESFPDFNGDLFVKLDVVGWEQSGLAVILSMPPVLSCELLYARGISNQKHLCLTATQTKTYDVDDLRTIRESNFVILSRIVVKQGCRRGTLLTSVRGSMMLLFRLRVLSRRRIVVPSELDIVARKEALLSSSIDPRPPALVNHVNVSDELAFVQFKLVISCLFIVKLHDGA